jgi:putative DNA modification/repair radical SAM protein
VLLDKVTILGEAAKYDVCASSASPHQKIKRAQIGHAAPSGVCHSFTPDGRCISLFKILMTNECSKDCAYCPNRVQRDIPRTSFSADELSTLFLDLYRRNYVEGLFLSSGVKHNCQSSMTEMLKAAELLRYKHKFGGYIHLKILPGCGEDFIRQAARLANRVSLNMEVPNSHRLTTLSRSKDFQRDLMSPMSTIAKILGETPGTTHTTQYIVGATGESDQEILHSATTLYTGYRLKRAYFSAFQPVENTPLEGQPSAPLIRENRLYQSDFLMRQYGFDLDDFVFDQLGNLDLTLDPKLMYAIKNPQLFPLEINKATYNQLLRVPGIGPTSAERILKVRRQFRLTTSDELKNLGVVTKRALYYVTINGRHFTNLNWVCKPRPEQFQQLSLWGV